MNEPIERLRNLGPKMAQLLADVGIESEEDLRRIGPADAYARLRFVSERKISLTALYAMHAALEGCDWRDLSPIDKAMLRAKVEREAES